MQILKVTLDKICVSPYKSKGRPLGNIRILMQFLTVFPCKICVFPYKSKAYTFGNTRIFMQIVRQPPCKICVFPYKSKRYNPGNTRIFMQILRVHPCKICVFLYRCKGYPLGIPPWKSMYFHASAEGTPLWNIVQYAFCEYSMLSVRLYDPNFACEINFGSTKIPPCLSPNVPRYCQRSLPIAKRPSLSPNVPPYRQTSPAIAKCPWHF